MRRVFRSLSRAESLVLGSLAIVFVGRCVAANAVVPPWQGPDEPGHFALVYQLVRPTERPEDIQAAVLESMERNHWWELYQRPMPNPRPRIFSEADLGDGTFAQPLYYGLGAYALKVTRPPTLERAYYDLRGLSIVLSVVTLTFAWRGTRVLFGADAALGATAVAALSPQFLLTAITVNADALLYVWGAFIWWQAARSVAEPQHGLPLLLLLMGAGAAVLTKRIGLTLVIAAAVVFMQSLPGAYRRRLTGTAFIIGLLGVMAAVFVLGSFGLSDTIRDAFVVTRMPDLGVSLRYLQLAVDYVWLAAGWSQFLPPDSWRWAVRILTLFGVAGSVLMYVNSAELRPRLMVAWLFVCVQVLAVMGTVMWTIRTAPNGRYFLSVLAPAAALFYLGTAALVPSRARVYFPLFFVAVLAALDITGITTVLVPAYLQ